MEFIDLAAQQARIKPAVDARIQAVLAHGGYIMGPEVRELETALASFCGAAHAITCANGTDALLLALMALDIGPGDAVILPAFTFAATAEMMPFVGATPVFADIDPVTYNLSPESLQRCIRSARASGLRPRAVMPVDLFGLPADYDAIAAIAEAEGMHLISDSAQGFGSVYKGRSSGSLGIIATTSFFPAKPLGCYGDGGAMFTPDPDIAALLDSFRVHGKGREKYDNVRIGMNSRLDTLQAAILLEKLAIFADELDARQRVAARYTEALQGRFVTPHVPDGLRSSWAQYTLRARTREERDALRAHMAGLGVPTMIYYPLPLHRQTAYAAYPCDPEGLAESETAAATVFSLPMHPYLTESDQSRVIDAALSFGGAA